MAVQTLAPIHFCSTPAAVAALGHQLPEIAREAFLEIGRIGRGYEIYHHQFRTKSGALVAVASRVTKSGIVEIEIDLGNPNLPVRTFTTTEAARASRRSK